MVSFGWVLYVISTIVGYLTTNLLNHHHHQHHYPHHVAPPVRISLAFSHPPSLSSLAPGRSSKLHPLLAQSCCIQVLAGHPAFACLCEVVHRSMSLRSSSLLLQQCPACLVHLTLIVFMMGGWWPYSYCFVECCLQDLFNTARSILVKLPSSFFSIDLAIIHLVHPYNRIDMTAAWKKLRFILSVRSDFHMTNSWSIAVHAFANHILMSVSVDETLLSR